ncbi:hypothetical protein OE749_08405 [Aestuariibacter sp. AA17]|uniref:Endonuclease n=1 Tax=Fluctibacter corallii TaxID=2984329 RepID=A0ABT3A7Q5_9ALTE|nr:hypothetical protein [Aestuariibacter sp. AA17]MCV2884715.1 hypothetical protein [Aestuariibacter sp. AA17]
MKDREVEFQKSLIQSQNALFEDVEKKRVLEALVSNFPDFSTFYPLDWIPEQGEDIYIILINKLLVVKVEVDKFDKDKEAHLEIISIKEYRKNLSKIGRLKLAVALDLANL